MRDRITREPNHCGTIAGVMSDTRACCQHIQRRGGDLRDRRAFTLMELLVVIAIIATLAAVVAPEIFHNLGDAKTGAAQSQIEMLSLALNSYRLDNGEYPTQTQGLAALRVAPTGADAPPNWRGPYLTRDVPMDPWRRPYVYTVPGTASAGGFDLYTLGKDGKPGGEGEDSDVTSWGGPVRP